MLSLDHYSICGVIGEGGFGEVFLAIHKETGTAVAIKKIPRTDPDDPEHQSMIEREIDILCRLEHPCIYRLFDFIRNEDFYFLIFEYLDNGKLLDFVNNNGRLLEKTARQYFTQLISALKYLNDKGIAHRDIKAENILLDRYFNLRLIDFGLSNYFNPEFPIMRTLCGCQAYASPEMLSMHPYMPSSDIWSCGILLFAICAGYLPFSDSSIPKLIQKVINDEPTYPNFFSDELVDLLKQMLDKNPLKRISISEIMKHPWFIKDSLPTNFDSLSDEMERINKQIPKSNDSMLINSKTINNNNNENNNENNNDNKSNDNATDNNNNDTENVQLQQAHPVSSLLKQNIVKDMREKYGLNPDRIMTEIKYSPNHLRIRPNNETVSYEIFKRMEDTDDMAQMYPTVKSHLPGGNDFSVLSFHNNNNSSISFKFANDENFVEDNGNNIGNNEDRVKLPPPEPPKTKRFVIKPKSKTLSAQAKKSDFV